MTTGVKAGFITHNAVVNNIIIDPFILYTLLLIIYFNLKK